MLETTGGLWGRTQRQGADRVSSIVIPMLTSIKLYPATGPEDALEPFLLGGLGFTLGIDDRKTSGTGGLLGGSASNQTVLVLGIGVKAGLGVEYRLGHNFGLSAGAGYQFTRFLQGDIGGDQTFKGLIVSGGLTYRFQY